jgi:hypothetical protein
VWTVQGFAQEEDIAFKKIVADYEKASGKPRRTARYWAGVIGRDLIKELPLGTAGFELVLP